MAFVIGEDLEEEIRQTFTARPGDSTPTDEDSIRELFKQHKKLTIKQLNRKWDILSLESYIDKGVIPCGLCERVIPAEHPHNKRFLSKWKREYISHGLAFMKFIVEEEKLQSSELQIQIDESLQ